MKPEKVFILCKILGFSLMFALWLFDGQTSGFLLILTLVMMSIIRHRFPKLKYTILLDIIFCFYFLYLVELGLRQWDYINFSLIMSLFSAMYLGVYFSIILLAIYIVLLGLNMQLLTIFALSGLCGLFLRFWTLEYTKRLKFRDKIVGKQYEMESFQYEQSAMLIEVEKTASLSERTRIARDIHDNAGHEIVAAYISFQAIRKLLDTEKVDKTKIITMYDTALKRLNNGTTKIRETAHNLQSTTTIGVESLIMACRRFPMGSVDFRAYGETMRVPMYVWNVITPCLNECLTNIVRHSHAKKVTVTLDVAKYIVRLCVENDGVPNTQSIVMGMGLRNIRQRVTAVGGSLSHSVSSSTSASFGINTIFRVICVIPIKEGI